MVKLNRTEPKTETTTEAKDIAKAIYLASTPQQRGAATRRLNAYLAKRQGEGKNPKQVHASIKSYVTRYQNGGI